MKIGIVSFSRDKLITLPLIQRIASALELQLYAHFSPVWQAEGVPVTAYASLADVPKDTSPLLVFDEPDQEKALGWHSVDVNGRPLGRAFWHLIQKHGGTLVDGAMSLSVTLSHEVLEMVGNPYVNFWADMPSGEQEAIELADRVEADFYRIEDGVSVSNFLTPRAFRDGAGPYDFLDTLRSPWEIRPGGYTIRRSGDKVYDVWGEHYPRWKREMKEASPRLLKRHADPKRSLSLSERLAEILPGLGPEITESIVALHQAERLERIINLGTYAALREDAEA